ncbi:MBL fold metallo-hydrolase [Hoylesella oralis]|uniref:MBL fold metallo-hydrolase n=1 Tax=Hoylesella oralis TaxID=28134 RepID=UPI0028E20D9A|nr:MBL fold metallo-hydrolase [Hoylesella oralis]
MKQLICIAACLTVLGLNTGSCSSKEAQEGIDTYTLPNGKKLVVTPIKHASLQLNYDGWEFEIDPVSSAVRPIIDYTDKPKADFILVTHEHYDHFDMNAIHLLTKNSTNLLLNQRCFDRYKKGIVIRNGEKAELTDSITLYAVPAYNRSKNRAELHPKGRDNGYILDLEGYHIYIAGSTEFVPEMKDIKDIDIAFMPYDKYKTMTLAQFRKAAKTIRPKILYPYHMHTTDPKQILKVTSGLGIDVRIRDLR